MMRSILNVTLNVAILLGFFALGVVLSNNFKSQELTKPVTPNFIYEQFDPTAKEKFSSLVHLQSENGFNFCSGVVVSDHYVLTAAHCISTINPFMGSVLNEDDIFVTSDITYNKTILKTKAKAFKAQTRADYGIIKGNFKLFKKAKMTDDPLMMYKLSNNIVACGFPQGIQQSVCYPAIVIDNLKTKDFFLTFKGFLIPGMSGGPVIDRVTNTVFAVNSQIDDLLPGIIKVAPLIGIWELLKE